MQPTGKNIRFCFIDRVRSADVIIRCIQMMPFVTNIEYLLQHERSLDLYFGTYVYVRCLIFCKLWLVLKLICCLGIGEA
jgi:hypothetical protein